MIEIEEDGKPCSAMREALSSSLIVYDQMDNTFYLDYEEITYCPWCGRELSEITIEED